MIRTSLLHLRAIVILWLAVFIYASGATAATIDIGPNDPFLGSSKANQPYAQTFTASGGSGNYSFVVSSGNLPGNLSLSQTGVMSGTPTTYNAYNFTIRVNDDQGNSGERSYTLYIRPDITVSPGILIPATAGTLYSQQITVSGAQQPYSFSLTSGSLPNGIKLSSSGLLSGITYQRGTHHFLIAINLNVPNGTFYEYHNYTLNVTDPVPVAHNTAMSIAYNSGTVSVPLNITDGTPASVAIHNHPATGTATVSGLKVNYTPQPGFVGTVTFTYTASNAFGTSAPALVTVTVNPPSPPVARDLTFEIQPEDLQLSFNTEATGEGPFLFSLVTYPSHYLGFTFNSNGTVFYSPKRNSDGSPTVATDSFMYQAIGPGGASNVARVTINILNKPAPVAAGDSASTLANQSVIIPVTANDSGSINTVTVAKVPSHGTATVNGLVVTYEPATNFFGTDSFTYSATGPGGTSAPATVTIIVSPLQVPTVTAHSATSLPGIPVTIDVTVGATGGPFTTAGIADAPATGTVSVSGTSITYTPAENSPNDVNFSYTLSNPFGTSEPATISVKVNPKPVATEHSVTTIAGTPVSVLLTKGATGGPFVSAAIVSLNPSGAGTVSIEDNADHGFRLIFAPTPAFTGVAAVRYTLRNAFTTSAPADVTITVMARDDPSMDPEVIGLVNAQAEGARRFADAQLSNYSDRLRRLRRGDSNESHQGISLNTEQPEEETHDRRGQDVSGFFSEPRRRHTPDQTDGIIQDRPVPPSRFGVWTAGQIEIGDTSERSSNSALSFTTSGVSAGLDYRFSERFIAGIGIGYGKDRTEIGNNGTRSDGESWSIGTYGSLRPAENTYLEAVLGYGALSFNSKRYLTGADGFAYGSRDGQQVFGSLKAGYEVKRDALYFSPYAGLDASWTKLGSFDENNGGTRNLHYGEQTVNSLVTVIGFEADYTYLFRGYRLAPNLKAEWRYDLSGESDVSLNYLDWAGGPSFLLANDPVIGNAVRLGAGLDMVLDQGLNLGFGYTTSLGEGGAVRHGFNAKIAMRF